MADPINTRYQGQIGEQGGSQAREPAASRPHQPPYRSQPTPFQPQQVAYQEKPSQPTQAQPAVYQPAPSPQMMYYQPYQVMTAQGMQTVIYYPVAAEKKEGKGKRFWRIIYPLLVFFGLQIFASIVAVVFIFASYELSGAYYWDNVDQLMWEILAIGAVADVIMIPLCIAFMRMDENRKTKLGTFVKFKRVALLPCIIGLFIGIAMAFLASGIFAAFGRLNLQAEFESYAPHAFWAFLIIGVLAPVTEELLFRVVLYSRLRESFAPISAGLVCALIFALAHGSAVQGVTAFFYGLALCLVYEHWKSYVPVLLMHMGINCTVITIAIVSGGSAALFTGLPLAMVIAASALALTGCIAYTMKSKPTQREP